MNNASSLPRAEAASLAVRLRRLSLSVQALVLLGVVATGAGGLAVAVGPGPWLLSWLGSCCVGLPDLINGEVTAAVRWRLAGALLPIVGLTLALFWQLWSLFGQYRRGRVFSAASLTHLRRFGWLMVLYALARPLTGGLLSVAVSLDNPPGQRHLVLGYGSDDYALLLLALVFVAIAKVMAEAARAAEENEQFV